jgi:hypothetical protein
MFRKVLTIVILAAALGAFLYFRPLIFQNPIPPRIIDRMPSAEFIGRANILELARETSGMMYYHKLPFRDLTTYEFLLGQGKMYGLNLQKPVYFFGNERGDWGCMVEVLDSSKISPAIERLKNFVNLTDTSYESQRVLKYAKEKLYLTYESKYLFIYQGKYFNAVFQEVKNAQYRGVKPEWKRFIRQRTFKNEHLAIFSNWDGLKDLGIETALFAHDSDSLSFNLKAYMKRTIPFYIKQRQMGFSFRGIAAANKSIELHLDISELKKHPKDPILLRLSQVGKKFGFPFKEFLRAWDGNLNFMEGGIQTIQESYIETELDDDFNTVEVEKTRDVKVPGYSLQLGANKSGELFLSRLMQKGLVTQEGEEFRFLFSPLLKYIRNERDMIFYSGNVAPRLFYSNLNRVIWMDQGTRYAFSIDTIKRYEIFGSLQIPVRRIFRRNKLI